MGTIFSLMEKITGKKVASLMHTAWIGEAYVKYIAKSIIVYILRKLNVMFNEYTKKKRLTLDRIKCSDASYYLKLIYGTQPRIRTLPIRTITK